MEMTEAQFEETEIAEAKKHDDMVRETYEKSMEVDMEVDNE